VDWLQIRRVGRDRQYNIRRAVIFPQNSHGE
jgi:hypothetical protein